MDTDTLSIGSILPIVTPSLQHPLDKNRKITEGKVLLAFVITLTIFIAVHLNVLAKIEFFLNSTYTVSDLHDVIRCSILNMAIMLAYVLLLLWATKTCIALALIYVAVMVFRSCAEIIQSDYSEDNPEAQILSILSAALTISLLLVSAYCIKTIDSLTDIIKKASRAIVFFYPLILFGFVMLALAGIVVALAFSRILERMLISESLMADMHVYLAGFAAVFALNVICYFGRAVTAHAVATYYCTPSKEDIMNLSIFRSISTVMKFHLGTILCSATWVVPYGLAVYVVVKTKFQYPPDSGNVLFRFVCKCVGILCAPSIGLMVTAAQGQACLPAIKTMMRLMLKNSLLSIAVASFSLLLLASALAIASTADLLIVNFYSNAYAANLMITNIFVLSPIIVIIDTSIKTIFLCAQYDDKNNVKSIQALSCISNDVC